MIGLEATPFMPVGCTPARRQGAPLELNPVVNRLYALK